jgi:hypothetical protein
MIGALFAFTHWTFAQFAIWAEQAVELTKQQRDMIFYARWWRGFWWLYSPMIIFVCLGCAFLHWFMTLARSDVRRPGPDPSPDP